LEAFLDFPGQGKGCMDVVGAEIGNMQKVAFHGGSSPPKFKNNNKQAPNFK
jgi:hypothetical protein